MQLVHFYLITKLPKKNDDFYNPPKKAFRTCMKIPLHISVRDFRTSGYRCLKMMLILNVSCWLSDVFTLRPRKRTSFLNTWLIDPWVYAAKGTQKWREFGRDLHPILGHSQTPLGQICAKFLVWIDPDIFIHINNRLYNYTDKNRLYVLCYSKIYVCI